MATPAQIRANRANARKSTGPRTPAGKARSSRNGLRHGFRSPGSPLAPSDHAAFARTFDEFRRDLHPATPAETACVVEMVAAFCHTRLLDRMETDLCQQRLDIETAFRKLKTLARYRTRPERRFYRALRQWEYLRASSQIVAFAHPALGAQTKICTSEPNSPSKFNTMAPSPSPQNAPTAASRAPENAPQPASPALAPIAAGTRAVGRACCSAAPFPSSPRPPVPPPKVAEAKVLTRAARPASAAAGGHFGGAGAPQSQRECQPP